MPHGRDGQTSTEPEGALPRTTILIFAAAAGLSVANIYYAQPLLDAMAQEFGISPAAIGLVVTLTQVGYGLGLIFIVPLGDLIDRRRLILGQGLLSVLALVAVATAETGAILFAGMAAVGLLAVVVQVLVAFAATLATPTERGRVVGTVTSGIVIGILAARFAAGILADIGGWRAVYLVSAILSLALVGLLVRVLPRHRIPAGTGSYVAALRSVPILFLSEPVLLVRGVLALLIFASFSTFWTALVLPLSAPPFLLLPYLDRPVRPRRPGGSDGRNGGRAARGPGPRSMDDRSNSRASARIVGADCAATGINSGADLLASSCSISPCRPFMSRTRASSFPCVPKPAAGSSAATWCSIQWAAPPAPLLRRPSMPGLAGPASRRSERRSALRPCSCGCSPCARCGHVERNSVIQPKRQLHPRSSRRTADPLITHLGHPGRVPALRV